jgi:TolB protein
VISQISHLIGISGNTREKRGAGKRPMKAQTSLCARGTERILRFLLSSGGTGILPVGRCDTSNRHSCESRNPSFSVASEGRLSTAFPKYGRFLSAQFNVGNSFASWVGPASAPVMTGTEAGPTRIRKATTLVRDEWPHLCNQALRSEVRNRILILVLIILLPILTCSPAAAKIEISLTDPNFVKTPIAVQDFVGQGGPFTGRDLAEIIKHDLYVTGLFQPLEIPQSPATQGPDFAAWSQAGAQFVITAVFQVSGDELVLEARLYDAALKKQEIAKRFTGKASEHRRMVHRFADRVMEKLTGTEGCFSSKIAFAGQAPAKEIYFMDFDGHNTFQLTRNGSINMSPDWSPDNRTMLFTSYLNRNPDLWMLDMATLQQFSISSRQGINASGKYSPDGAAIALSLSFKGIPKIFIITPQGNIINRLTNGRGNDISPTWSPDGSTIAYVSDGAGTPKIYTIPATGGEPKPVTFNSNYNTDPDWSPRGDLIAFTARIEGRFQICTIRPDGTGFRVLTSAGQNQDPAWSPDGRMIAFTSDRDGRKLIYIMDASGQIQERVSRVEGKGAAWSRNFR